MALFRRLFPFILLVFALSFNKANGQQTPLKPISYRVFTPFIFNPAIAGSKDFSTIDLLISNYDKSNSQIISGNLRFSKSGKKYFSALSAPEFTNIGVGGYLFNDLNDMSRNIGIGGTIAYHLQLDKNALSFLSFGVSPKAVFNKYSGDPDLGKPAKDTFYPNFDAGIYYYSTRFFAGVSGTNLLGNPEEPDSLGVYAIPVSRQLFLQLGYKFVLSKSLNILLEPSIIVNTDDTFSGEIIDMFKPALKFYAGNFCLGTYFNDLDKISFFFRYNYSRFYIGTYFELPYNSPFYKQPVLAEFAAGINLSAIRSGFTRENHW